MSCGISGDVDGLGADVGASAAPKMAGKVTPAAFGGGLDGYGEGSGFVFCDVGFKVGCVCFGPIGNGVFCPFRTVEVVESVAGEWAGDLPLGWGVDGWGISGFDVGVDDAFEVIAA